MSKIGRRGIPIKNVDVVIDGNAVAYKGKEASGRYVVPSELQVALRDGMLYVQPVSIDGRMSARRQQAVNAIWGLHRALLSSVLAGAATLFERQLVIVGLGFKALPKGAILECTLGFSHKIMFPIPEGIAVTVDKSGQKLSVKASNAERLGHFVSQVRALRPPEPYKGTGVMYAEEVATLRRKEGKKK